MTALDKRQAAADDTMTTAFRAAYKRQANGELTNDETVAEMEAAHDEHLATTKAIWGERNSGGAR